MNICTIALMVALSTIPAFAERDINRTATIKSGGRSPRSSVGNGKTEPHPENPDNGNWKISGGKYVSKRTGPQAVYRKNIALACPAQIQLDFHDITKKVTWKSEYGIRFLNQKGDGIEFYCYAKPTSVQLRRVENGEAIPEDAGIQNTVRVLGGRFFDEPYTVRILLAENEARLHLDFFGQDVFPLQGRVYGSFNSITHMEIFSRQAEVVVGEPEIKPLKEPLPVLNFKPPVGDKMPSWQGFVGTHYTYRPYLKNYRAPVFRYDEEWFRNTQGKIVYNLARGASIKLKHKWKKHAVDMAAENESSVDMDEVIGKQMELAHKKIARIHKGQNPDALDIFWQMGNEINRNEGINNERLYSGAYTYDVFEPFISALRQASADLFNDEERLNVMYGSMARSAAPDALCWLKMTLNRELEGKYAPALKGKKAWELCDYLSVQYACKGPFATEYLNYLHDTYIKSGKFKGFWSTEELGGGDAVKISGPKVLGVAVRYMDWWSRHDWEENKGMCYFWGDWWGLYSYPSAFSVEEAVGGFLKDDALENLTDEISVSADPDAEVYVFSKKESEKGHYMATLMTGKYSWNQPVSGTCAFTSITIPVKEQHRKSTFRTVIKRVAPTGIPIVQTMNLKPVGDGLKIPVNDSIRLDAWEILLVFATAEDEEFHPAFAEQKFETEPNKLIPGGEIISFYYGNNPTSAGEKGLDEGMKGDGHRIAVSPYNRGRTVFNVYLENDYEQGETIEITPDLPLTRSVEDEEEPSSRIGGGINIYWDNILILKNITQGRKPYNITLGKPLDFSSGKHKITMKRTVDDDDYRPSLDALRIRLASESNLEAEKIEITGETEQLTADDISFTKQVEYLFTE